MTVSRFIFASAVLLVSSIGARAQDQMPTGLEGVPTAYQAAPPAVAAPAAVTATEAPAQAATDRLTQLSCAPTCTKRTEEAKQLGAQVFFRFGGGFLTGTGRGNSSYTDTLGANGVNDGRAGFAMGFGLHLPLMKDPVLGNTVLGEVLIDYAQFSNKRVVPVTSALFNNPVLGNVRVNQLAVVGSPKYRIDSLGKFRPWVIPAGMAFLVNSPPSDNSSYLDVAVHFGGGADYRLTKSVSLGVDCRYNLNLTSEGASWLTTGLYLGFDF